MAFHDETKQDYQFGNGIADCFQCGICLCRVEEPMQCVHNEHSFCKKCITRHLRQSRRCPICQDPLTLKTLRPSRLVANLLCQLKSPCVYAASGCPEVLEQERRQTHITTCGFCPVQCPNTGCGASINRKDKENHERNYCNFRKTSCNVCGRNVLYKESLLHCYVRKDEVNEMKASWEYENVCINGKLETAVRDFESKMHDTKLQVDDLKMTICELKQDMQTNTNYQLGQLSTQVERTICELKHDMQTIETNTNYQMDHLSTQVSQVVDIRQSIGVMRDESDSMGVQIRSIKNNMADMKAHADIMSDRINDTNCKVDGVRTTVQLNKEARQSEMYTLRQSVLSVGQNVHMKADIIIAGGQNNQHQLNSVEMFTWADRKWSSLNPMLLSRSAASSFVCKGQMVISGGIGENDSCFDGMECIEFCHGSRAQWNMFLAKLPQQFVRHKCVVYGNSIFVIGGRYSESTCDSIYSVSLEEPYTIQSHCQMPEPRQGHGAELFRDRIVVVGGTSSAVSTNTSLDSVLNYDIKSNTVNTLAALPVAVSSMATVLWKDNVLIIGGRDKNNKEMNDVIMYNITNEKSTMLPSMKHKRSGCAAVIVGDVIVVMGGRNREEGCLDSTELFSFDQFLWQELCSMKDKRWYASAVVKTAVL